MKSKPRIIFLFLFVFLFLYALFDMLVIFGVSRSRAGDLGKVNKICDHDKLPELAIFGSSVSEVGINAPLIQKQTNLATYNFSIDGTRFVQLKGLIDEFSSKNDKTKYVILAESYFSLTSADGLRQIERYLANISNKNVYNSLYNIQPGTVWKCRYIPAYKYTTVSYEFYLAAWDGWKRYFNKPGTDTLLGYTPEVKEWQQGQVNIEQWKKEALIKIDSSVVQDYKKCVLNLKSKGIKVIMILPPVYSVISKQVGEYNMLRNALDEIAKETNCVFWDFSTSKIGDDKSLFYNTNHLNSKGANIFSAVLADSINSFTRHLN